MTDRRTGLRPRSGPSATPDFENFEHGENPDRRASPEHGDESAQRTGRPRFHHKPVLAVAAALTLLLLALSGRYGYHSDELYFRAAGQRLDWGYDDQPPLVPLLARLQTELLGDTPLALRALAALLAGGAVLLAALIAREVGGNARGQVLAAVATAVSAGTLAYGHMFTPGSVDSVVWMTVALLLLRMLNTGDRRLWLPIGAVFGIGMLAKSLAPLLALGLVAGLLCCGPRSVLRGKWLAGGVAVALLITAPNLVWQAANGWPQVAMARALSESGGMTGRIELVPAQLLLLGPFLAPVWIAGLVALLWRRQAWRRYRSIGVAYVVILAVLLVVAGQPRYASGLLQVLLAIGGVVLADWSTPVRRRAVAALALAGNAVFAGLVALPIAPAAWHQGGAAAGLSEVQTQQMGWQRYAEQVAGVYRSLPPGERSRTAIVAGNYAEAGALDRYGPALGLPPVYSGHNSYHGFGRPKDGTEVVLLVGQKGIPRAARQEIDPEFNSCQSRPPLSLDAMNPWQHSDVLICRGPHTSWVTLWSKLRWLGIP
ncbi:glycosyltransferase family 39 protein [Streptomyces coeruleorubidus]|uniref:glycosyltransferase family 39 protein n=1 Tax=Streptomyces coeruleorubidus TaxID=116188 RepID=UPI00369EE89B